LHYILQLAIDKLKRFSFKAGQKAGGEEGEGVERGKERK
jgi:hypothetical protein